MNNKAFTLIELLAVIVILAIIALIAVPIVVNIIDDSKKSSNEESIKMYGKAIENAAGNYFLKHPEKKNVTVQNLKDENLINYDGAQVECKIEKIYKSGKIYLKDCTVGGTKVDYTYGEESYKDYIHLVEDADPIGLSPGDKYTYDVNDNDTFYFYILSIEENQVNLIMDRNICGSLSDPNDPNNGQPATEENKCLIAWYSSSNNNSFGPVTAMTGLYNATKEWINVPNMIINYNDEANQTIDSFGYGSLQTTQNGIKITMRDGTEIVDNNNKIPVISYEQGKLLKARLPKEKELTANECKSTSASCPIWLVHNLSDASLFCNKCIIKYATTDKISEIHGYWLMSGYYGNIMYARRITSSGTLDDYNTSAANIHGIRPVITVPISNF